MADTDLSFMTSTNNSQKYISDNNTFFLSIVNCVWSTDKASILSVYRSIQSE